jgi:glycine oxidase
LLLPLGWDLPVTPVRGQIALVNPGRPIIQHVLMWGAQYMVPRSEGRILVGSTEEHVGFDKKTTAAGIQGLLALAIKLVPELGQATLEQSWAGLRPGSPDHLPYLGRVPGTANLLVATGHFRAGIQLSLGTAQVVAELVQGLPLTVPIDAFTIERVRRSGERGA